MEQLARPRSSGRLGRVDSLDELITTERRPVLPFADQLAFDLPLPGQVSGQRWTFPRCGFTATASPAHHDIGCDQGDERLGAEWPGDPPRQAWRITTPRRPSTRASP